MWAGSPERARVDAYARLIVGSVAEDTRHLNRAHAMMNRVLIDDLAPGDFIACERLPKSRAELADAVASGTATICIGGSPKIPNGWPLRVLELRLPWIAVQRLGGDGVEPRRLVLDVRRYRIYPVGRAYAEALASTAEQTVDSAEQRGSDGGTGQKPAAPSSPGQEPQSPAARPGVEE